MYRLMPMLILVLLLPACKLQEPSTTDNALETRSSVIEWRLATSWPKNLPGLGMAPENFAQQVNRMSNGRLHISVYGAGELMPALSVFDGVSEGKVQMGHSASFYWKGKVPAAQFFSSIPFGLNAQQMNAWLYHGGGMELWQEVYQPFGIIPMAGGNTGMQMGGWFDKTVNSIDDLNGLKMRLPGIGGEVLKQVGGVPVGGLAGRELYGALKNGAIDAAEWVGPYNDLPLGLYQVAQYYYYPGWHSPGANMEFIINQQAFLALPDDLQQIIITAARAVNQDMLDDYTQGHIEALNTLINEHNVQLKRFPNEVIKQLKSTRDAVLFAEAEKDPMFKKVLQAYLENEQQVQRYFQYTEHALAQMTSS